MEIRFAGGTCAVEAPAGSRIQPATSKYAIPKAHPATGPGFKHLYELAQSDGTIWIIHVSRDRPEVGWHFCEQPQECEWP